MNRFFQSVSRLVRVPVTRLVRPNRRVNAMMWDLQYALGFWRYLDRLCDGSMPLALIETWAPRPTILDLGCGTSANMPLHPGRYAHYHGVDVSRAAIRRARRYRRPHTSFAVADIRAFQTPERYDAVLLREVLYYLSEAEATDLLHRLPGMLTPRGRIVVQIHDLDQAAGHVRIVRTCGLPVHAEVPLDSDGASTGAFLVLGPAGGRSYGPDGHSAGPGTASSVHSGQMAGG